MAADLSPRARAILDEIERGSSAGRARRPVPPGPSDQTPLLPAPPARQAHATGDELGKLVEDVVSQAEQARLRLSALSEAIEDIAERLGLPLEPSVAPVRREESTGAPTPGGDLRLVPACEAPPPVTQLPLAPGLEHPQTESAPARPASTEAGPSGRVGRLWRTRAGSSKRKDPGWTSQAMGFDTTEVLSPLTTSTPETTPRETADTEPRAPTS